jgi:hypothetical protein
MTILLASTYIRCVVSFIKENTTVVEQDKNKKFEGRQDIDENQTPAVERGGESTEKQAEQKQSSKEGAPNQGTESR